MELPATAVYSPGTLGKGFYEVMPHNANAFSSQNHWKCRRKIAFSHLFGWKMSFSLLIWWHRMVCGKSLDTATLKRSVVLENRIGILSLDTFLLWIFIELNSPSTFENWWKTKKMLAVNVLIFLRRKVPGQTGTRTRDLQLRMLYFCLFFFSNWDVFKLKRSTPTFPLRIKWDVL
jgi:hypothetical protein